MEQNNNGLKDMALATLRAKHQNDAADIHRQLFYELRKQACPICDLPAKTFIEVHRQVLDMDAQRAIKSVEIVRERGVKQYDPKAAPPPVELKCATCGGKQMVAQDYTVDRHRIKGNTVRKRVETDPYLCPKCWWEQVGSKV